MTRHMHILKLMLIAGLGGATLTACVPGQYAYETEQTHAEFGQYGADYAPYGAQYGAQSGQYGNEYAQSASSFQRTRYGDVQNAGLRPPCEVQATPCGFMTVVPVYPVYQVVTQTAPEPEPIIETYVEPPVVEIYEPEPTVIVEPEPVYTPMHHWPEPETPVQSWKPIRK